MLPELFPESPDLLRGIIDFQVPRKQIHPDEQMGRSERPDRRSEGGRLPAPFDQGAEGSATEGGFVPVVAIQVVGPSAEEHDKQPGIFGQM